MTEERAILVRAAGPRITHLVTAGDGVIIGA
jgi:hypothetical protein